MLRVEIHPLWDENAIGLEKSRAMMVMSRFQIEMILSILQYLTQYPGRYTGPWVRWSVSWVFFSADFTMLALAHNVYFPKARDK